MTTAAAQRDAAPQYAFEGSVFVGGAVVQWLRDGLKLVRSAAEIEDLAATVPDNGRRYSATRLPARYTLTLRVPATSSRCHSKRPSCA